MQGGTKRMGFAKLKVKVPLKRRDKRVQRHVNRIRAYHKHIVDLAYRTYYE